MWRVTHLTFSVQYIWGKVCSPIYGEVWSNDNHVQKNDHLAQGRPHMALIWFHFSFIPPWQNNGRLWRLSYPLLFLSPRPKCLSLHRATLRPCAKGQTEISCTHIGLWLNPTSAFLLIVLDEGRRNRAGDPAVKTLRHFKIFGNWN